MKYSNLFTKTRKEDPKDEFSNNAKLLLRAGFINKDMAGVYSFLPLGLIVFNNIQNIIREEMNAIGGQEILMTALQDPSVWEKSGRWDDSVLDVWFKTQMNNGQIVGLGNTHEEPITNLMRNFISSYKDLPVYAYQLQTKFRNEIRAKSGIMRVREFVMKDLYSFNKSTEDLDFFYEEAKKAYIKIFDRVGIGAETYLTFASGGAFSKYSHEFQAICDAGEDIIYLNSEKKLAVNKEVYNDDVLKDLDLKKDELEECKAIEVGNIFKLGTRFSQALGLNYTDQDGLEKPVVMGSYGIGPGRLMGTIVELKADSRGMVWPEGISPFKYHLIGLNLDDVEVRLNAENLYENLEKKGVSVFYDDRVQVSTGEKFSDADLFGFPIRLIVSKKTGMNVEVKKRISIESDLVVINDFLNNA
jgi:prolyl-tRNA synthetase